VSFLAPRGRSRSLQPEGYAAFFMPPVHNLRVYLALARIREYIQNNPRSWESDVFHPGPLEI
jgi:hypothetical protein